MYEVMMGDPRSWGEDVELFEKTMKDHGVTPLPDPELQFPEWLVDLRKHWLETT